MKSCYVVEAVGKGKGYHANFLSRKGVGANGIFLNKSMEVLSRFKFFVEVFET